MIPTWLCLHVPKAKITKLSNGNREFIIKLVKPQWRHATSTLMSSPLSMHVKVKPVNPQSSSHQQTGSVCLFSAAIPPQTQSSEQENHGSRYLAPFSNSKTRTTTRYQLHHLASPMILRVKLVHRLVHHGKIVGHGKIGWV